MQLIPDGYFLVEDGSYYPKVGDQYGYSHWEKNKPWHIVHSYHRYYLKSSIDQHNANYKKSGETYKLMIISKNKPKPRFENPRPYPHGY